MGAFAWPGRGFPKFCQLWDKLGAIMAYDLSAYKCLGTPVQRRMQNKFSLHISRYNAIILLETTGWWLMIGCEKHTNQNTFPSPGIVNKCQEDFESTSLQTTRFPLTALGITLYCHCSVQPGRHHYTTNWSVVHYIICRRHLGGETHQNMSITYSLQSCGGRRILTSFYFFYVTPIFICHSTC